MSVSKVKELLELMNENEVIELEMEEGDFKVRLCKQGQPLAPVAVAAQAPAMVAAAPSPASGAAVEEDTSGLVPIKSPIVGTFYVAPSPDDDPFVSVGDKVGKDTVVCIVEAMKIMNEVKSGVTGTVEKILIENGEPVEYGQPLFLVKP